MRLNGWQRLWLLASIIWAVIIVTFVAILASDRDENVPLIQAVFVVVLLWALPAAAAYGLGFGVAWVRRGFQK